MDLADYIDAVTQQIRCKRARPMIARELSAHIEDQKATYLSEGMEEGEAEREAVRQMGDPVEVGVSMDRIHRPRIDVKLLVLVGIFSVIAVIFQGMMLAEMDCGGLFFTAAAESACQVAFGLAVMTGILFLDYTLLGKKPIWVWLILVAAVPFCSQLTDIPFRYLPFDRLYRYTLFGLMLPAYAGVIYYYRKKGWKGLFWCFFWLGTAAFFGLGRGFNTFMLLLNCFGCILLLTAAIASGQMSIPRLPGLVVSWAATAGGLGGIVFYIFQFGAPYQIARLKAIFRYSEAEAPYIVTKMKEVLGGLRLFGQGNQLNPPYAASVKQAFVTENTIVRSFPWEGSNALLFIAYRVGIAGAVAVVAGLLVLFIKMLGGIMKQKSVLGSLVGTGCLLALLLPATAHILNNLTLISYADAYIPFLYPGWIVNAACYTLFGLYLSVYRNTDIVA